MNTEEKRVSELWYEKCDSIVDWRGYGERLLEIDNILQECDEVLQEAGMGIGFVSKRTELEGLLEDKRVLWEYVPMLPDFVSYYLDEPLYKAFNHHATETISRIKLEDFSVNAGENNQIGITESYYDPYFGEYKGTETKTTFRFSNFWGIGGQASLPNSSGWIVSPSGCVEEFAQIFEAQYNVMNAADMFQGSEITSYEAYLEHFASQGEFDHSMDKPFLSFVSSVLDITIIKPLIEACTGEDLITGEDLSDLERGLKVVFAIVDMVTIGGAVAATKLSEMELKEGLKALGKTVAIEFAANTTVCGVSALGEAFDWPIPITIMLSLATGITVSCKGNKLLFEGEGFSRELILDDVEVEKIGGMIEGGTDVVQSKFNKLLNSDYYKNYPGYDCSEIATDFYDAAGQQGKIYRIEGKDGVINGYEYGKVYDFEYHEVYSDGVYIYDPRYQNTPVLKDDYFRALKEINPDGFDVFTIQ